MMSAGRPIRSSARSSARPGRLPVKTSGATPHHTPHEGTSLTVTSQSGADGRMPSSASTRAATRSGGSPAASGG